MATLGKPAISTPRTADRPIQDAIDRIRERFQNVETEVGALRLLIDNSKAGKDVQALQAQLNALAKTVATLGGSDLLTALADLLAAGNGLVVLKDGVLITRVLAPGVSISIANPNGHDGNPTISLDTPAMAPLAGSTGEDWDWAPDVGEDLSL